MAMRRWTKQEVEQLIDMRAHGFSHTQCADALNRTVFSVRFMLNKIPNLPALVRSCHHCCEVFYPKTMRQIFCSQRCNQRSREQRIKQELAEIRRQVAAGLLT